MKRKIVEIDQEKCIGCGLCADACHEHAIEMIDGKATLIKDDYCDGFGDCLPACPADAIQIIEREAAEYDEEAVKARQQEMKEKKAKEEAMKNEKPHVHMCPGSMARMLGGNKARNAVVKPVAAAAVQTEAESHLRNWPVQIQLAPLQAPYFDGAKLLVASDCTAYSCANFHDRFIKDHMVLIGCPKLDPLDYSEKLSEIIRRNDIRSIHVLRMEVPCCGGMERAVETAIGKSGKMLPWKVTVLSVEGEVIEERP